MTTTSTATAAHTHRPDWSTKGADTTVCGTCGRSMEAIRAELADRTSRRTRKVATPADPMAPLLREIDNERRRARRRAGL